MSPSILQPEGLRKALELQRHHHPASLGSLWNQGKDRAEKEGGVCDTVSTAKQTAGPFFSKLLYQPNEVTKALLSQRQGSWGWYNILVYNWDKLRGYLVFKVGFLSHGNAVFRSHTERNSVLHSGNAQLTLGLSLWMFSACYCFTPQGFVDFVIPIVYP